MASKHISLGTHFLGHKKKEDLRELFETFDRDNDGKLSQFELQHMLHSAGIDLNLPDYNEAKSLNFEEFASLMRPTLHDPHRNSTKQQELREAFDAFDTNNDGGISVEELHAKMNELGDKQTLKEAQEMLSDADLDKDGIVNFEEFCGMMGVQPHANNKERVVCEHDHHRLSIRKFFCSHK